MEIERYPARYHDQWGEVATVIENDGKTLRMVIRDVEFSGTMLDDLESSTDVDVDTSQLSMFTLNRGKLCGCTLEFDMPLTVLFHLERLTGILHVKLTLGLPAPNGGIDREDLLLTLTVADQMFVSPGTSGWFENELLAIHMQLPEGMYMRTCLFCAFSDYHPVGNGLFGCLSCFRQAKQDYLSVRTKNDLLALYRQKLDEAVQETYCCSEFSRRTSPWGRPFEYYKA